MIQAADGYHNRVSNNDIFGRIEEARDPSLDHDDLTTSTSTTSPSSTHKPGMNITNNYIYLITVNTATNDATKADSMQTTITVTFLLYSIILANIK